MKNWSLVVLCMVLFFNFNCGGTDPTDDADDYADNESDTGDDADGYTDSDTDGSTDSADVAENDAENPEADVQTDVTDPLADYLWLESPWKRISVDGIPSGLVVEVTVVAWDPTLGAEVHGFTPLNISYIKKNPDGSFKLFVEYEDGNYAEGWADPDTGVVEFDYVKQGGAEIHHNIFNKLE